MADLDTILWLQNPVFAAGGRRLCTELAKQYPTEVLEPDTVIANGGDPAERLYVLLGGTIRLFHRSSDGREAIVKLLRAPNSYGDIELLQSLPHQVGAATVDTVRATSMPAAAYVEIIDRHPAVARALLQHMSAAFCVASRNERQVFAPLKQRIANLVLSYADFYGQPTGERLTIAHPLSLQTVARSLGVSRRSVAAVFGQWRKEGLVSRRDEALLLEDVSALEDLAAPIRGSLCYQLGKPLERFNHSQPIKEAFVELSAGNTALCGTRYAVGKQLLIGRQPPSQLLVPNDTLSPQHCRVFQAATGGRYWVEDLDSLNETRLRGRSVRRAVLSDGDVLELGTVKVVFHLQSLD